LIGALCLPSCSFFFTLKMPDLKNLGSRAASAFGGLGERGGGHKAATESNHGAGNAGGAVSGSSRPSREGRLAHLTTLALSGDLEPLGLFRAVRTGTPYKRSTHALTRINTSESSMGWVNPSFH